MCIRDSADGEEKAWRMCEIAGKALNIDPSDVIVASTGVIGQVLPIEPIEETAPLLASSITGDGSSLAAKAIMTTDTVVKEAAAEFEKMCIRDRNRFYCRKQERIFEVSS